ncbi:MAG: hypothetical protein IT536_17745 [Hyphomicrobiales bacterium]|nr:hypothetical protein [Hyphomicrobiales bacterium]
MSSPKRAAAKTKPVTAKPKPAAKAKAAAKPAAERSAPAQAQGSASSDATRLAAAIERATADGKLDLLTPQALQALMSACCKTYATRVEAGENLLPIGQRSAVSPTEVMVTASGLLRAANLAVFELGMWQSWTGR